jgi:5-(carboxyamino)imidazole ribonucleotide synthase
MRIGILGGGQLGRMLALAAHPLGLSTRVLEPGASCPAAVVAEHIVGEYEDYQALYRFCQGLDTVTYEFENVPLTSALWLSERLPVFPHPMALRNGQDRIAEKLFFESIKVAVPPYASIESREDLDRAIARIGLPAVLKTTRFGYDGKGQAVLKTAADVENYWEKLGGRPLILEGFVSFEREVSILGVRGRDGATVFYPLVENVHREGILRKSTSPSPKVTPALQERAEEIARKAMEALDYVGVLAVELFQVGENLIVNEMAPRVHNSGHWTIEGAETSQFENHMRAVAGLPLGKTDAIGHSVMLNLIGNWPDPKEVLQIPGVHLHLYGKEPRANRKVGHITIRAMDSRSLQASVEQVQVLIDAVEV